MAYIFLMSPFMYTFSKFYLSGFTQVRERKKISVSGGGGGGKVSEF